MKMIANKCVNRKILNTIYGVLVGISISTVLVIVGSIALWLFYPDYEHTITIFASFVGTVGITALCAVIGFIWEDG